MTYSISISGHGDEPYEEREAAEKRLLGAVVKALDEHGGNVSTFSFSGNEVRAATFDGARALVAEDAPTEEVADDGEG